MKIAPYQIDQYIKNIASAKIAGALIFGPEESIISHNIQTIAKKITPDLTDPFLVTHLSKDRFAQDNSCLADEFYSMSMLGGRKLIMIKDPDATATASLKSLLADKDSVAKSENFILVQAGDLDKSSSLRKAAEEYNSFAAIACYEDDERTTKNFIENELRKNEVDPQPDCIQHLFDKLGKNRQIIANEIYKIATYLDGADIEPDLIDRAIGDQAAISTNEFINNFVIKNYAIADEQSKYLLKNGFDSITLIRFLANYLQKLYQAKTATDIANIDFEVAIKNQKLFFKVEAEFRRHLKLITLEHLKSWLQGLQNLEIKIKTTSTINQKLLFAIFLQDSLK